MGSETPLKHQNVEGSLGGSKGLCLGWGANSSPARRGPASARKRKCTQRPARGSQVTATQGGGGARAVGAVVRV